MYSSKKAKFLAEIANLHKKNMRSKKITPDYFEPGSMEYLDKYEGVYNRDTGEWLVRVEVKGTRYEDRTEQIENIAEADKIKIVREDSNPYNSNNFYVASLKNKNLGNLPAEICNALAPLFDEGKIGISNSFVSYVEPISKRSRHAKQAILFVEIRGTCEAELIAEEPECIVVEEDEVVLSGSANSSGKTPAEKDASCEDNEKKTASETGPENPDETSSDDKSESQGAAIVGSNPVPIFIKSFNVYDNVGVTASVIDNLKKNVKDICKFHAGSEFDASKYFKNPRQAKTYNIFIENGPNEKSIKEEILKAIGELLEFIDKADFSKAILTSKIRKEINSKVKLAINNSIDRIGRISGVSLSFLSETILYVAREILKKAIEVVLSKLTDITADVKEVNLYSIFDIDFSSEVYVELCAAIGKILGSKNIVNGCVDAKILTDDKIKKIVNAYLTIISNRVNKQVRILLSDVLGSLRGFHAVSTERFGKDVLIILEIIGSDGEKVVNKIYEIEAKIRELHSRGYFNPSTGIHIYWDRIGKSIEKQSFGLSPQKHFDMCVKVAAHEMEHAWHYADVVSSFGDWDGKNVPETNLVQETIAEYFSLCYCKNSRNSIGETMIRSERDSSKFPNDGGYSGALIVEKKVGKKTLSFSKFYQQSLTNMAKAYAEIIG